MKEAFHLSIQLFESEGGVDDRSPGAGRDAGPAPGAESLFDPLSRYSQTRWHEQDSSPRKQASLGHAARCVVDKGNHLVPWSNHPEEFSPAELLVRVYWSQSQIILWEFLREIGPVDPEPISAKGSFLNHHPPSSSLCRSRFFFLLFGTGSNSKYFKPRMKNNPISVKIPRDISVSTRVKERRPGGSPHPFDLPRIERQGFGCPGMTRANRSPKMPMTTEMAAASTPFRLFEVSGMGQQDERQR